MTEQEWLTSTDPWRMLGWLRRSGVGDRRTLGHLFAACCSRIQSSIAGRRSRSCDDDPIALTHAQFHLFHAINEAIYAIGDSEAERATLATLFRDIIGPLLFRPVAIDPAWVAWNDGTIPQLAQIIYDERAFDRLPFLADALEEAGCDNADILSHCRSKGPHCRGCWPVDLILGKS